MASRYPEAAGGVCVRPWIRCGRLTDWLGLALGIKAVLLLLAIFDDATLWMAVFADMGASLLVVANGLRLLRARPS